jgi:hypothetical protein
MIYLDSRGAAWLSLRACAAYFLKWAACEHNIPFSTPLTRGGLGVSATARSPSTFCFSFSHSRGVGLDISATARMRRALSEVGGVRAQGDIEARPSASIHPFCLHFP